MSSESMVYVVDDDISAREAIVATLRAEGIPALGFASAAAFLAYTRPVARECLVLDVDMPELNGLELQKRLNAANDRVPVVFITGHGDVPMSVAAVKAGASDFLLKPLDAIALVDSVQRALALAPERGPEERVVGTSPAIQRVLRQIEILAPTDTTVLLQGETGTGKEPLARAIHEQSGRTGRFVKVNCAAIPAGLLESELMGNEKGAFTGAVSQRVGRFELAQDGTIFLDEIGEMPLDLQPKLLRLLQEREFERIGGAKTLSTNARVIAATNRNLKAMAAARTFREDLYYRLSVFPIMVPPLRERKEDIGAIAMHVIAALTRRLGKRVQPPSPELLAAFADYDWPGNIRELQNVLERAVLMAVDGVLEAPELMTEPPLQVTPEPPAGETFDVVAFVRAQLASDSGAEVYQEIHRQVDRILFKLALAHTRGNQRDAARLVGISRQTMRTRLRSLGLYVSRSVGATPDDDDELS